MNRTPCPKCHKMLVMPRGPEKAKLLLIGEFPGYEEIRQGFPFVGNSGEILRSELLRAGLAMNDCRLTNLWLHDKDEKNCDMAWHLDRMVKEFKGRTHILLMGSDVVSALLGESVSNRAGLPVKIPEFPKIRFWVSPNPAVVFHGPVGDFRMSIERFVKDAKK